MPRLPGLNECLDYLPRPLSLSDFEIDLSVGEAARRATNTRSTRTQPPEGDLVVSLLSGFARGPRGTEGSAENGLG